MVESNVLERLNQDLVIRRFHPARVAQEQRKLCIVLGNEETFFYDFNDQQLLHCTPSNATSSVQQILPTYEEEKLVDSFLNVDDSQEFDDSNKGLLSVEYEILSLIASMVNDDDDNEVRYEIDQGFNLVHMLLACAEAVACRDTQLVNSVLTQVLTSSSPWGDSLQHVSYCFALGLKSRLDFLLQNVNLNGTFVIGTNNEASLVTGEEKLEAFGCLYQTIPYIAFGFMVTIEAICEATHWKDSIHIVDLGIEHALQWPALIQALALRPQGPPKVVHITGLINPHNHRHVHELESKMKLVIDETNLFGVSIEFTVVYEVLTSSVLTKERLDVSEGETIIVNSIMHFHKYFKE